MKMPAKALLVAAALAAMQAGVALQAAPARADALEAADTAAESSCQQAGEAAELRWNLPSGLLTAIGRMESGRYDLVSRRVIAWPWTINAAGLGAWFESPAQAIEAVLANQMRGIQSIDIGCFQVNLMYHPTAFASLEQGFDARANADYAARFLSDLHDRGGSWERAVAWYHSATPGVGDSYRDRVLADWSGGGVRVLPMPSEPQPGSRATGGDPFVVLAAMHDPGVRVSGLQRWGGQMWGVRVWAPGGIDGAARPTPVSLASREARPGVSRAVAVAPRPAAYGRLPRIVTPRS